MYVVCVTFEILPEYYREFCPAVMAQAANSLRLECDCHVFDVCEAESDHKVFLYEHYSDRPAFEAHLQSDHFLAFDTLTRAWVQSKNVTTWRLLEQSA